MQVLCEAQADVQHSHQLFLKGVSGAWQVEIQILYFISENFQIFCEVSVYVEFFSHRVFYSHTKVLQNKQRGL